MARLETVPTSQKMIVQPHALREAFPMEALPLLTDSSIIVELVREPLQPAKINSEGDILAEVKYTSRQLTILKKYVEVEVIDEFEDHWIGMLFELNVKGTGGKGDIRGCVVDSIKDNTIHVRGFNKSNHPDWLKVKKEVEKMLRAAKKNAQ